MIAKCWIPSSTHPNSVQNTLEICLPCTKTNRKIIGGKYINGQATVTFGLWMSSDLLMLTKTPAIIAK